MSSSLTAYERVLAARKASKISIQTLINGLCDDFMAFHGDRAAGDDPAVIGGIGLLGEQPVTVVGIQKGDDLAENNARHFGCAEPEGYRKVLRLMQQAEKFQRPIVALINTPGAFPGVDAEYHGQGSAIAQCLLTGLKLKVPYISVIVGEGGSGGALALAVGDTVWMFENSVYSILSPEGYATILWKDSRKAPEAAEQMGLTPEELKAAGIIDRIIPEVTDATSLASFKQALCQKLQQLQACSVPELLAARRVRYRQF